eukprot:scaffold54410_cov30-Tisochrysis_lutea.AAC.1
MYAREGAASGGCPLVILGGTNAKKHPPPQLQVGRHPEGSALGLGFVGSERRHVERGRLGARVAGIDPKTAQVSFQRLRLPDKGPIDGDELQMQLASQFQLLAPSGFPVARGKRRTAAFIDSEL